MGLFHHQDQHGDNSSDVDRNSASGARGNQHEACDEQQVQHSLQDDGVLIQVSDGEFPEHHSL